MPTTRLPSAAGCTLEDAGQDWDAIRVPRTVGAAAIAILGSRCGAVVDDPLSKACYFFTPVGTASRWDVPGTRALGDGAAVTIPPARRTEGRGPHWRVCPGDDGWITDPRALEAALEDSVGTRHALTLLELPALDGLSDAQTRGATCVWCPDETMLTPVTAVDLGEHLSPFDGREMRWFPRAHRRCVQAAALAALHDHAPLCEQCVDDASSCTTGLTLRRLMREYR